VVAWQDRARHHYLRAFEALGKRCDLSVVPFDADGGRSAELPDIVLSHGEYESQAALAIGRARTDSIPTLTIMDGVLEWRNSWAHPRPEFQGLAYPMLQPVLADKVACIGRSQARILESWGNVGKCEVVGVPRLDDAAYRTRRTRAEGDPLTILVMTAKTPGFTPEQLDVTRQSLVDVKAWLDSHHQVGDVRLRAIWRLTAGIADAIGVDSTVRDLGGEELAGLLTEVDAVVSTASTTILEVMLRRIPVALLDYHNSPQYVPAAWSISSEGQIDAVVRGLANPEPSRMLYQNAVLTDALECHSLATPRMVRLIEQMVAVGRQCRAESRTLSWPKHLLLDDDGGVEVKGVPLSRLFPGHPELSETDLPAMQVELGHARAELRRIRTECEQLRLQVACSPRLALAGRVPLLGRALRAAGRMARRQ